MDNDLKWMEHAYELAIKAEQNDEVPVGAVIILEDTIIGQGWNKPIYTNDPAAHAEIIALREAGKKINNYRLVDATMYVTLEPCVMCAGAIVHSRLSKIIYAVDDPKTGACGSVFNLLQSNELNHKVDVEKGIMEDQCRSLIQAFFKAKRMKS